MSNILNVADISVVIPTHNRCELLNRAITSVLNQTIRTKEIFIVDNGSTDNTYEMICSLFPEISYIHEKRKGVSIARNIGIKNCQTSTTNCMVRGSNEFKLGKISLDSVTPKLLILKTCIAEPCNDSKNQLTKNLTMD